MAASIARLIALALLFALLSVSRVISEEARPGANPGARRIQRSTTSLTVGYAWDEESGHGVVMTMRGAAFPNDGPWYFGFGSLSGYFFSTREALMETCLFAGWDGFLGGGAELDACLGIILSGARLERDDDRLIYRSEGPALQPSLGICLPISENADVSISAAPVIRPYDLRSGTWALSRSYIVFSASLRLKNRFLVERLPWNEGSPPASDDAR
jgi:hypothetical protein